MRQSHLRLLPLTARLVRTQPVLRVLKPCPHTPQSFGRLSRDGAQGPLPPRRWRLVHAEVFTRWGPNESNSIISTCFLIGRFSSAYVRILLQHRTSYLCTANLLNIRAHLQRPVLPAASGLFHRRGPRTTAGRPSASPLPASSAPPRSASPSPACPRAACRTSQWFSVVTDAAELQLPVLWFPKSVSRQFPNPPTPHPPQGQRFHGSLPQPATGRLQLFTVHSQCNGAQSHKRKRKFQ